MVTSRPKTKGDHRSPLCSLVGRTLDRSCERQNKRTLWAKYCEYCLHDFTSVLGSQKIYVDNPHLQHGDDASLIQSVVNWQVEESECFYWGRIRIK